MSRKIFRLCCILLLALWAGLAWPRPASADGGIVVTDPQLWAMIDEGQQIAVLQLNEDETLQVDLFITMLDRSGETHTVVFFIPLGEEASDFNVVEETSLEFDEALTAQLDEWLEEYGRRQQSYKSTVQASLMLGTVATNGLWTWLVAAPLLASGCAPAAAPIATFQTESSYISIYDLDEQTDVQVLIETTGLDASVKETLEDLRGQQIAVIELQTQAAGEADEWTSPYESKGQPGIHLTWSAALAHNSPEAVYDYPLSTGRAWASPIELTRIYIVAPPGTDFEVDSPELGADLSGMTGGYGWGNLAGRIYWRIDEAKSPAFAEDNAYGGYGRIWRGTFIKSNSDRDIRVTKLTAVSPETQAAIRLSQFRQVVTSITWLLSLLVGAAVWVITWRLVMKPLLRVPYRFRSGRLWGDAFTWSLLYPGLTLLAMFIVGVVAWGLLMILVGSSFSEVGFIEEILNNEAAQISLAILISLPLLITIAGLVNGFLFARTQAMKFDVSRWRAFGAYLLVILAANVIYFIVSVGYAALVGAI